MDAITFLRTFRFVFASMLIVAGLLVVMIVLSNVETSSAQPKTPNGKVAGASSPNAVTSGAAKAVDGFATSLESTGHALNSGVKSTASTTASMSKSVAHGVQSGATAAVHGIGYGLTAVGRAIGTGVGFVARGVGNSVLFVLRIPGNIWGFVTNASGVNAFIRPADHEEVPIIDPESAELKAALAALPAEQTKKPNQNQAATPQQSQGPQWPIHGRVTTEFGVDHWPFQRTHTGMDISNGSGNIAIKPFRNGRVTEVIHSDEGLGNHVTVDHGNGVTSVYAHMSSISVNTGQKVDLDTTLGFEGTTGVSTGVHLHFEILVNGQAANPRQFISGQP